MYKMKPGQGGIRMEGEGEDDEDPLAALDKPDTTKKGNRQKNKADQKLADKQREEQKKKKLEELKAKIVHTKAEHKGANKES